MYSKYRKIREKRQQGFTLIEVMIVIFILMVLSGIGVVAVQQNMTRANKGAAKLFIDSLKTPLDTYLLDHGHYPTTAQGLHALLEPTDDVDQSKGPWPYIDLGTGRGTDPWGQPYQYQYPGQRNTAKYDVWSLGPDMTPDTGDEIGNW